MANATKRYGCASSNTGEPLVMFILTLNTRLLVTTGHALTARKLLTAVEEGSLTTGWVTYPLDVLATAIKVDLLEGRKYQDNPVKSTLC